MRLPSGLAITKGAAEHVVVWFLDDVYALRDPLAVGVIDCRGRPGDHESDFARAGRVAGGVLVAAGPDGEQHPGCHLEGDVARAGEVGLDVEQVAVEGGGPFGVADVGQEQVGCRHGCLSGQWIIWH
mgnify:CR=1 FL=1